MPSDCQAQGGGLAPSCPEAAEEKVSLTRCARGSFATSNSGMGPSCQHLKGKLNSQPSHGRPRGPHDLEDKLLCARNHLLWLAHTLYPKTKPVPGLVLAPDCSGTWKNLRACSQNLLVPGIDRAAPCLQDKGGTSSSSLWF